MSFTFPVSLSFLIISVPLFLMVYRCAPTLPTHTKLFIFYVLPPAWPLKKASVHFPFIFLSKCRKLYCHCSIPPPPPTHTHTHTLDFSLLFEVKGKRRIFFCCCRAVYSLPSLNTHFSYDLCSLKMSKNRLYFFSVNMFPFTDTHTQIIHNQWSLYEMGPKEPLGKLLLMQKTSTQYPV